jgi:glycosyltransferase involved in cell wall biosynthesis
MQLVIDARMLDHSGVGVYLSHVIPGVVERVAAHSPLVLAAPRSLDRVRELVGGSAQCLPWRSAPLSPADFLPPPVRGGDRLWWVPHYNVPLASRSPMVVTLHDVMPLSEAARHWPVAKRLVARAWLAAIRRRALRVLCDSAFTQEEAIRLAGIERSRTEVVPLGVEPAGATVESPCVPGATPYLLFVGLVKPHKNLAGLLRAFESISSAFPHRLVVVGRHAGLRDVDSEALALAARLAPRVELIDSVPRERLAALVAGATALVQPSFYEGFGLPPLEAMARGTPVISSRAASLPEVCGDAALYFDPASPAELAARLREVLSDGALRERLRARGLEQAGRFTWERCTSRTGEILLEALRGEAASRET